MTGAPNSNLTSTALIRAAFRELLAARAKASPATLLPFEPAETGGSFFVSPERPRLTRQAMEEMGQIGELTALENLWRAKGHESLLVLIPHLRAIAGQLALEQDLDKPTAKGPAGLIYQMY